jgi:hypothetical protein
MVASVSARALVCVCVGVRTCATASTDAMPQNVLAIYGLKLISLIIPRQSAFDNFFFSFSFLSLLSRFSSAGRFSVLLLLANG